MSVRIRYACPHCSRRIVHHPELAGQLVICSACKGEFYEPTDPLPGKAAERALQALPQEPRRLRVPEGNNPRHDLALLSRRDASDMRTITEIVEAVLLDDNPPLAGPASASKISDVGYSSLGEPDKRRAKAATPSRPPTAQSQTGSSVQPLTPGAAIPSAVMAKPARPVPKPATPDRPLAGVSVKQMAEELRRRGMGVAFVTCEVNPMRDFELVFSDNMTRDDALAILRKYLDTLREVKSTEKPSLLERMWKKGERE